MPRYKVYRESSEYEVVRVTAENEDEAKKKVEYDYDIYSIECLDATGYVITKVELDTDKN